MHLRNIVILASAMLVLTGCQSMSSTMLTRDESNQVWTRKNQLKGVPITLKVPTHVQLTVIEKYFLVKDSANRTRRVKLPYTVRDISQEFVYTEKIFTVDFERPVSGTYDLHLNLTPDQYIQQLQYNITDRTIRNVKQFVGAVAPSGLGPLTAHDPNAEYEYEEIQSVIAVGMFEVDAPDFEEQMMTFVNCHLNQSHDAWVAPPGVKDVHRTRLSRPVCAPGDGVAIRRLPPPVDNGSPGAMIRPPHNAGGQVVEVIPSGYSE